MSRSLCLPVVFLSLSFAAFAQSKPAAIEIAPERRIHRNTAGDDRARIVRPIANEPVAVVSSEASAIERRTFELINAERRVRGLTPLKWNNDLSTLARNHSHNMAEGGFFSHKGTDGSFVDQRAESLGMDNWAAIGENIAFIRGYDKPADTAVEKWMQSPSHRNNLLSPRWREGAVGIAVSENGTLYFTQVFILRN